MISKVLVSAIFFFCFSSVAMMPKEQHFVAQAFDSASLKNFEIEKGHHSPEKIRLESKKIAGSDTDILTYLVKDRVVRQLVLLPAARAKLLNAFEVAFPAKIRQRLLSGGPCGQPLRLHYSRIHQSKVADERFCLDTLPAPQQVAVSRWWRESRDLLGL